MNKIDIQTGGHRRSNDAITFLQTALTSALGALSTVQGDSYIIKGCELVYGAGANDPVTCTEGYMVFKGEVMYVPAHQVVADKATLVDPQFVPIEAAAGGGLNPVLYNDGLQKNVFIDRTANVVNGFVAGSDKVAYNTLENFTEDTWHEPGLVGEPTITGVNVTQHGSIPMRFRKVGDRIEFRGAFNISPAPSTQASSFFTLPEKYRPLSASKFRAIPTQAAVLRLEIKTNGEVYLRGSDATNNISEVHFEGLHFYLDRV